MSREIMFQTIGEAFEFMRDSGESQALTDAMNAYALGKDKLEQFFGERLWLDNSEDDFIPFHSEADKQYYIELGSIEEFLCTNDLIYNDGSSFV